MQQFDLKSSFTNRDSVVTRNIKNWQFVYSRRFPFYDEDGIVEYYGDGYCWHGTAGADFSFRDSEHREKIAQSINAFNKGFSKIKITHHMFGEGNMLGNYFVVEGVHDDFYCDVAPTGNFVKFSCVAIACFSDEGKILEERELWDEVTLLRQINFIPNDGSFFMTGVFNDYEGNTLPPVYPSPALPQIGDMFCKRNSIDMKIRSEIVSRNIANWREFTAKKYTNQDFENIEEVMAPDYLYFGTGGARFDMSDLTQRREMFDEFKQYMKEMEAVSFPSQLFGEGNIVLYLVIPDFIQTGSTLGVPPTGREIRFFNISIGYFDNEGRIKSEFEAHDFLANYKQMGIIPSGLENISLLSVLRSMGYSPVNKGFS